MNKHFQMLTNQKYVTQYLIYKNGFVNILEKIQTYDIIIKIKPFFKIIMK